MEEEIWLTKVKSSIESSGLGEPKSLLQLIIAKNNIAKSDTAIKNGALLIVFMIFCLMKSNNNHL